MVNPSWREDVEMSEMKSKCVLIDCPQQRGRIDCQFALTMGTPGNECWPPLCWPAWLAAQAEKQDESA